MSKTMNDRHPVEESPMTLAHRLMTARIIDEASFEAILDHVFLEATMHAGAGPRATIKQARYRRLCAALRLAVDAAVIARI